jgi:SMC interacting uncharacterized protein involved in chromosome segregation
MEKTEEKLVEEVRGLLLEAKKKEKELKGLLTQIAERAGKLKNHKISFEDFTVYEIATGGP